MNTKTKIILLTSLVVALTPLGVSAGSWEGSCYAAGGKSCAGGSEANGTPTVICPDRTYINATYASLCSFSCDEVFSIQGWDHDRDPKIFYQHCYKDDELHSKKLVKCREIHGAMAAGNEIGECGCQKYYEKDSSDPWQCVLVGQKCEPTTFYSESKPTKTECRCPSGTSLGSDGVTCFPINVPLNPTATKNTSSAVTNQPSGTSTKIQPKTDSSTTGTSLTTNGATMSAEKSVAPVRRSWIQWFVDIFRSLFAKKNTK